MTRAVLTSMNAVSPLSTGIPGLLRTRAAIPRGHNKVSSEAGSVVRELRLSGLPRRLGGLRVLSFRDLPHPIEALPGLDGHVRLPRGRAHEDLLAEFPPQPVELLVHPALLPAG